MKTAFTVVAEDQIGSRYHVSTKGWSTGRGKNFNDEAEAHAHAIKNSKRLIGRKPNQYQYDYQVIDFHENPSKVIAIYRNGEPQAQEDYDAYGSHKEDPNYRTRHGHAFNRNDPHAMRPEGECDACDYMREKARAQVPDDPFEGLG